MIKRLLFFAACGTLWFMFGAAPPASADSGPHLAGAGVVADGCASCHRTHTAQAGKLLKTAQTGLCYSCHGTTGTGAATDVQGGTGYSATNRVTPAGALRGGGFVTARINSLLPSGQAATYSNSAGIVPVLTTGANVTSAHTVDGTTDTNWGNGAISTAPNAGTAVQLTCGSCHDPHGNGNFRILKSLPTQSGATVPVAISDEATKVYTTANYWKVDDTTTVTAGTPKPFIANVSAWCSTCHTRYLAPTGSGSTTSGDAIFTYRHISNATLQGTANCIQCHVSHGSNAAMAAVSAAATNDPGGTVAVASSRLLRIDNRGTCQMCHLK